MLHVKLTKAQVTFLTDITHYKTLFANKTCFSLSLSAATAALEMCREYLIYNKQMTAYYQPACSSRYRYNYLKPVGSQSYVAAIILNGDNLNLNP